MNYQTYTTKVDLSRGGAVGRDNATSADAQPAGFVPGLPDRIWAADSFEWALQLYEDNQTTKLDCNSATATLYIGPAAAGSARTAIGTGTVGGTGGYIVTFAVPAGSIPSACFGIQCRVMAEIVVSGKQTTIWQDVEVVSYLDTGTSSLASTDDLLFLPTGTVTAYKCYYNAGGTWTLADPDVAACETAELFLALGSSVATSGMASEAVVTNAGWSWGAANVGKPIYLDDAGALTLTVPASPGDDGRVGRVVAWVRSDTSVRFDGHVPGVMFEATAT